VAESMLMQSAQTSELSQNGIENQQITISTPDIEKESEDFSDKKDIENQKNDRECGCFEENVSVYDLKEYSLYEFTLGGVVLRGSTTVKPSGGWAGEIVSIDGTKIDVVWSDKTRSIAAPYELIPIESDDESDDEFESDSFDSESNPEEPEDSNSDMEDHAEHCHQGNYIYSLSRNFCKMCRIQRENESLLTADQHDEFPIDSDDPSSHQDSDSNDAENKANKAKEHQNNIQNIKNDSNSNQGKKKINKEDKEDKGDKEGKNKKEEEEEEKEENKEKEKHEKEKEEKEEIAKKEGKKEETIILQKKFPVFEVMEETPVDHYFRKSAMKLSAKVGKRIAKEWKILQKHLADGIFVKVFEDHMNLLQFIVLGAKDTPYHSSLFLFDVMLPNDYPNKPPVLHYHSYGFRVNPNLYIEGKVCLSLLGTWSGKGTQIWNPSTSNLLQVILSLQGLVLGTSDPYYLEAGYGKQRGTIHGLHSSLLYNEKALMMSLQMTRSIMNHPPPLFAALIHDHFQLHLKIFNQFQQAIKAALASHDDAVVKETLTNFGIRIGMEQPSGLYYPSIGFINACAELLSKIINIIKEKATVSNTTK